MQALLRNKRLRALSTGVGPGHSWELLGDRTFRNLKRKEHRAALVAEQEARHEEEKKRKEGPESGELEGRVTRRRPPRAR